MPETIQEFVDSSSCDLRLDRHASVLKGVKLLGLKSRNGRSYQEDALRRAIGLYEGARVNVNHPEGDPLGPRDYRDRLGVVRNVELRRGEGLFGALHFNPNHPLAEQLAWDAEHAPENVGLSHNVLANTRSQAGRVFVEEIVHVQSVDLVADPATTDGLYEHEVGAATGPARVAWELLTLEEVQRNRPDLWDHANEQQSALLNEATAELESLRSILQRTSAERMAFELLAEHGLRIASTQCDSTAGEVSRGFVDTLIESGDKALMRQAVKERADLAAKQDASSAARSKEQAVMTLPTRNSGLGVDEFVSAICPARSSRQAV